ncbi:HlyD family efflux transporter periplasmic adaptor subunit [Roseovarius sp. A21]|uniref:HlyD family efflux transporter periplasmic adaptor subunit n=1 Tax=Roseovarius bejariae TaxID=2576383 RepID=A0A844CYR1_9RHOB|nr:HlyD family efflux transporter periplasmic adaptor subunit [Roseovarius bejariae]MRU14773.1 HlyD family efflux transporter periplasmic adaptor subunit [Roseovarius bejariae]
MKTRTVLLTVFGVVTAGMLGIVTFRTDPVPVDIATATRGPMQVTVNVEGETRIAEVYDVAAPIRGVARRSPVRVGDGVTAGETVVAVIDPAASDPLDPRSRVQAEAAIREAEAGLHMAQSRLRQTDEELELAQSEYRRAKELVERGVASMTRLENAEQTLGVRQAAQEAAASNLEMARGALDRARAALIDPGGYADDTADCCQAIKAPVDGRVLSIAVISERPVAAGTPLLSIGQPGDLEIVADVLSTDAVRLEVGDPAIVERWGGAGQLAARVSEIEPSAYTKVSALGIEEQRVDVVFDLISPLEERPSLGHGFAVYLRVVEWESDDVLQIPLSALFRYGQAWAVFVMEDETARLRPVEIGHTNDRSAVIVNGLSEAERVLVHPNERIEDGTPIVLRLTE